MENLVSASFKYYEIVLSLNDLISSAFLIVKLWIT